jgi:hypothetical protein
MTDTYSLNKRCKRLYSLVYFNMIMNSSLDAALSLEPETAIVGVAAVAALILGCWWLVSVVTWLAVECSRWPQKFGRWTVPGSSAVAKSILALTLPLVSACSPTPDPEIPTLSWVDDTTPPTTTPPTTTPPTTTPPTTTSPTTTQTPITTPSSSEPAGLVEPVAPPTTEHRSHIVLKGEHLWSIARNELTGQLGRPATDSEVSPYWRRLIAANRSSLFSGDPDLIHPGEELMLPTPSRS